MQSHWKRPGGSRAGAFLNEYVRPPWAKGCPEPFSTATGSRGHNPGAETWIAEWTMEQQGCADMAPPDENRMKATVEKVKQQ